MRWPDGLVTPAWVLPAGTVLEVVRVTHLAPDGFTVHAQLPDLPEVSLRVLVADLEPEGEPVPF